MQALTRDVSYCRNIFISGNYSSNYILFDDTLSYAHYTNDIHADCFSQVIGNSFTELILKFVSYRKQFSYSLDKLNIWTEKDIKYGNICNWFPKTPFNLIASKNIVLNKCNMVYNSLIKDDVVIL